MAEILLLDIAISSTTQRRDSDVALSRRRRVRRVCRWGVVLLILSALVWKGRSWLAAYPKWKARQEISAGHLADGKKWLSLASKLDANDPEAVFLEARILRKEGDFHRFGERLQRARELGLSTDRINREQWLAWAQSGQLARAEPHLSALLRDPRGDGPEICEAFANGYLRNHRIPEAVRILTAWAADFPSDPRPYFFRGRVRARQRSWKEAELDFRNTLELDAGHYPAAFHLGRVLRSQKRLREAIGYFQMCEADPDLGTSGRIGQAACWRVLGEHDKARAIVKQVLSEQPDLAIALLEMGQLELDEGHYNAAVKDLSRAYEKTPRDLSIRYALGTALRGAGQPKQAESHLKFVSKAREMLSKAQLLQERVARNPRDVAARYEIGVAHLKYGLPESGVVWLLSTLEYAPDHQPTHKILAEYYESRARDDPSFAKLAERHQLKIVDH